MQHVGAGGHRHVGAVVDREQRAVGIADVPHHRERAQLVPGLQGPEVAVAGRVLVPQLHDVDAACQRGGDVAAQGGEVARPALRAGIVVEVSAGVDAEVEAGVGEAGTEAVGAGGHGFNGR